MFIEEEKHEFILVMYIIMYSLDGKPENVLGTVVCYQYYGWVHDQKHTYTG
jgi:hypothetical protein